ncbi:E3 ubiquitin-protein ligase TRIM11-like [Vombatus ursinus]|uniref:E3 ubiquitin-protein ligase TRIM11-like n=1 Tax=Vombatus ursinus TaxID=29139 RepID=UPI000FFD2429|nr:E3 ubiquitin-protein ligase TRIM11-like [Vombatus ursinus]XP_027721621.1 E3 ubiquitin-protein ligase TRIM11-like [Vombatus ursinus]
MASCTDLYQDLQEELICPICREYFTDPVTIECGHSFCQSCLLRNCQEAFPLFYCLECRSVSQLKDFQVNVCLGKLAAIAKKSRPHSLQNPEGHGKYEVHEEVQKLFCRDDHSPICVSCSQSQKHEAHILSCIHEAAEDFRGKLDETVNDLWRKSEKVAQKMANGKAIFKIVLKRNESVLSEEIENFHIRRIACPIPGIIEAISNFKVDITLDPSTASPDLIISEDLKSVSYGGIEEKESSSNRRFGELVLVLGTQFFISKRYYWEVNVPGHTCWCVGVCRVSSLINGYFALMALPENNRYYLYAISENHIHQKIRVRYLQISELKMVGIFLDYDHREISFYHVRENYLIYTFPTVSFLGPLRPLFSLSKKVLMNDGSLTICP